MDFLRTSMCGLLVLALTVGCGAENSDTPVEYEMLPANASGPEWFSNMSNIDDDYVYGVGSAASSSEEVAKNKAEVAAMAKLSSAASAHVKRSVKRALMVSGDFERGDEEIVENFADAAMIKSSNVIKAREVHKDNVYRFRTGYKAFVCFKIDRDDLDKKVYEVIEQKANTTSNAELKRKLQKSLESLE